MLLRFIPMITSGINSLILKRFMAWCITAAFQFSNAEPAWKNELTSPAPGAWPKLPPCTLDMQVNWKGMLDAGKLRIEFAPKDAVKPGTLVVRSSAASTGPAALLFSYQSYFWSELDPESLRPRFFNAVETDHREKIITTTRHFADRVESIEITQPLHKKSEPIRNERIFRQGQVFDIFSAMLHVRSHKLKTGDRISLVIQPFDNPYLLRVKVIGREIHNDRKAIKLTVGIRKIDRKTLELRPYNKMKTDATLWLSDDDSRIPVELRAAVFIGEIRAVLTEFRK
jgi:hypothetical protein